MDSDAGTTKLAELDDGAIGTCEGAVNDCTVELGIGIGGGFAEDEGVRTGAGEVVDVLDTTPETCARVPALGVATDEAATLELEIDTTEGGFDT